MGASGDTMINFAGGAIFAFVGAWMAWVGSPKGNVQPVTGYLLTIVGIGLMFIGLWEAGLFGDSKLLAIIPGAISIALLVAWLLKRRRRL